MSILTIRLPEEKHQRLRQLAERREISVNKLIEELATVALAEFDAETRFRIRGAAGSPAEGLRLLAKIDGSTDPALGPTRKHEKTASPTRRRSR